MRKSLFVFLLFALALFANAQEKSVTLNYSHITDIDNSGIGINAKFNLRGKLKVAPDFTYYFKRNTTQLFNANLNLGYSIDLPNKMLSIMPYAGVGLYYVYNGHMKYSSTAVDDCIDVAANFGLNIELNITRCVFVSVGAKYMLGIGDSAGGSFSDKDYLDQFVINSGIGFRF